MSSNDSSTLCQYFFDNDAQDAVLQEYSLVNTDSQSPTPQSSRSPSLSPEPHPEHDSSASWISFNDMELLESPEFHSDFCYGTVRPNFRLISSDNVLYHVHRQALRRGSSNMFNRLLRNASFACVPEQSAILSVILHAIYEMSFGNRPSISTLVTSVNCFPTYGLEPRHCLEAGTHLYAAISGHNACTPLLVYTFAAKLGLEDLAVNSSKYMMSFVPKVMSDSFSRAIGTQYLRRLFRLQHHRTRALTKILLKPLQMHSPIEECTQVMQLKTTRAWKMATASLVFKAHPTVSCAKIDATYRDVVESVECAYCRDLIDSRVQSMLVDWSKEKSTI